MSQWLFCFLPCLIFGISLSRGSGWATHPEGNVSFVLLRFEVRFVMSSQFCVLYFCKCVVRECKSGVL